MQITLLSGTNRRGSRTRKVVGWLEGRYAEHAAVRVVDLVDLPPEALSPDAYDHRPLALAPMVDAVLGADGLVVVTPEYNGGFPGALKLFIDLLPFPVAFERRAVCFVGVAAGRWGALRPVEQLQAVFGYRNAHVFPERVFVPGAAAGVGDDGAPTDAEVGRHLDRQVHGFVRFVDALTPLRAPR